MKKNKVYMVGIVLILIASIILFLPIISFAEEDVVTEDHKISMAGNLSGDDYTYGFNIGEGEEQKTITFKAKDFNLPTNLMDFDDKIRLRVTYSKKDETVKECKIINYLTGEIITDTSEENIRKLFDVSYGKTEIEKAWVENIKLSELKENELYKFTAKTDASNFPKIENDLGKNCATYIKKNNGIGFEKFDEEIMMNRSVDSKAVSFSFSQFDTDEYFYFLYKTLNNEELLQLTKDELIRLSDYKDGDELQYKFEKYIYNDTDKDITLNMTDVTFEIETKDTFVIKKDEICGFDWMLDSVVVSYSSGNINNSKNENNATTTGTTKNEVATNETTKQENKVTTANKVGAAYVNKATNETEQKIPEAGKSVTPYFVLIIALIVVSIMFKRYYDLNEDMKLK